MRVKGDDGGRGRGGRGTILSVLGGALSLLIELRERKVGIASLFTAKASDVNAFGRTWRRRLDDDVRWEEQGMPYLSRDQRRAEAGEGDVNDGIDDEQVNGRVQGPRLADSGNG